MAANCHFNSDSALFVFCTRSHLIPYLAADEYGRPFIILKEQQAKNRVKGIEATKVGDSVIPVEVCSFLLLTIGG